MGTAVMQKEGQQSCERKLCGRAPQTSTPARPGRLDNRCLQQMEPDAGARWERTILNEAGGGRQACRMGQNGRQAVQASKSRTRKQRAVRTKVQELHCVALDNCFIAARLIALNALQREESQHGVRLAGDARSTKPGDSRLAVVQAGAAGAGVEF